MNRNMILTKDEELRLLESLRSSRGGFVHSELVHAISAVLAGVANAPGVELREEQARQLEKRWRQQGIIRYEGVNRGWVFK